VARPTSSQREMTNWDTPPDPHGSHTLLNGLYNFLYQDSGEEGLFPGSAYGCTRRKKQNYRPQAPSSRVPLESMVYFHSSFKATSLWAVFLFYKRGLPPLVVVLWCSRGDYLPALEGYTLELNLSFYYGAGLWTHFSLVICCCWRRSIVELSIIGLEF